MKKQTQYRTHADACVDDILAAVGKHIVLAVPLGLGKANHIANALFQRVKNETSLSLHIVTALTLEVPKPTNALSERFLTPIIDRLYGDYLQLDYAIARRKNTLPDNIQVSEFFLNPGSLLSNSNAQNQYLSSNYTHAARDLLDLGVNVAAQMVAPHPTATGQLSLSCNPDVTLDLIDRAQQAGRRIFTLAEINPHLPYLKGDAEITSDFFDIILEPAAKAPAKARAGLFTVPQKPVAITDYALACHASSMVKDNGTLQIGIGSMGDAIARILALRQQQNPLYQQLLDALIDENKLQLRPTIPVEKNQFEHGLYGNSEMLVEGLVYLRRQGVLKREVATADGNVYCHAGFYVGSQRFYQQLRELDAADLDGLKMSRISYVNHLHGDEIIKRQQRREARFINSGMLLTLTGAAISDAIKNCQVVSGVGGQYNFVAQAQELDDGHSILCFHSTREKNGEVASNIVWDYPHTTIPRHLRDIVVTEYGAADIRGLCDRDVIARILNIADSRFQDELLAQAKKFGKIESDYEIPAASRQNTPETINRIFDRSCYHQHLVHFPMGSDFSPVEMRLALALKRLQTQGSAFQTLWPFIKTGWQYRQEALHQFNAELERMNMLQVKGVKDFGFRLILIGALIETAKDKRALTS